MWSIMSFGKYLLLPSLVCKVMNTSERKKENVEEKMLKILTALQFRFRLHDGLIIEENQPSHYVAFVVFDFFDDEITRKRRATPVDDFPLPDVVPQRQKRYLQIGASR